VSTACVCRICWRYASGVMLFASLRGDSAVLGSAGTCVILRDLRMWLSPPADVAQDVAR
jgi:hypothetical protein